MLLWGFSAVLFWGLQIYVGGFLHRSVELDLGRTLLPSGAFTYMRSDGGLHLRAPLVNDAFASLRQLYLDKDVQTISWDCWDLRFRLPRSRFLPCVWQDPRHPHASSRRALSRVLRAGLLQALLAERPRKLVGRAYLYVGL